MLLDYILCNTALVAYFHYCAPLRMAERLLKDAVALQTSGTPRERKIPSVFKRHAALRNNTILNLRAHNNELISTIFLNHLPLMPTNRLHGGKGFKISN